MLIFIFIAYIHQNLVNVSNYKDYNFQEMLESFKHLNEKFHGEMRSGLKRLGWWGSSGRLGIDSRTSAIVAILNGTASLVTL